MKEIMQVVQSVTAILLIIFVLLQVRGTGFGRGTSPTSFTRRGMERLIFRLTFVVTFLFLLSSIISLLA